MARPGGRGPGFVADSVMGKHETAIMQDRFADAPIDRAPASIEWAVKED